MKRMFLAVCFTAWLFNVGLAQDGSSANDGYGFVRDQMIPCTSVKNQADTSTCWCFSTNSFLEAELIRMGKGHFDLSEMFVVRNTYPLKADRYVRLQGKGQFGGGGLFANVLDVFREYGAVPESVYSGKANVNKPHSQFEMDAVLKGMMDTIVERKPPYNAAWKEALGGVLDAYLGKLPSDFEYNGVTHTPKSFADSLGIQVDDYVTLTSYTHHPFYRDITLEIPDNWAGNRYWNVPLDELLAVIRHAVESGYSVAWDGDISEKVCNRMRGIAVWPSIAWAKMSGDQRYDLFNYPGKEATITPEYRQKRFDAQISTDDHLMHIVGASHDRNGGRYFVVKDSYGTNNPAEGMINMSEAYLRCQTVAILVHKDGLPRSTAERLGMVDAAQTANP